MTVLTFYPTLDEAQVALNEIIAGLAKLNSSYALIAKAFEQEAATALVDAEEKIHRDSFSMSAWASETLAEKYTMLAKLASSRNVYMHRVLARLDSDEIVELAPEPLQKFSGKIKYKWPVSHVTSEHAYVAHDPKRPSTLSRYGFREAWLLLETTVASRSKDDKAWRASASSRHVYRISDAELPRLQAEHGLRDDSIKRYEEMFGTTFSEREQQEIMTRYYRGIDLARALDPNAYLQAETTTPVTRSSSSLATTL